MNIHENIRILKSGEQSPLTGSCANFVIAGITNIVGLLQPVLIVIKLNLI